MTYSATINFGNTDIEIEVQFDIEDSYCAETRTEPESGEINVTDVVIVDVDQYEADESGPSLIGMELSNLSEQDIESMLESAESYEMDGAAEAAYDAQQDSYYL